MSDPTGAPGWEHEPTRRAVRRYRWVGRLWLVTGFLLVTVVFVIPSISEDKITELERTGRRAAGVVVKVRGESRFSEGSIDVRFEADGRVQVRKINLNSDSPRYEPGDDVDVIYNPTDPSELITPNEDNDPLWMVWTFVIGFVGSFVAIPGGWLMGRRARRWKRMLKRTPWRQVRSAYREIPSGRSVRPLLRLRENGQVVVGAVASTTRWRLRALRDTRELWIVGDLDGTALVAPTKEGPLFEVRQSRFRWRQKRWAAEFA